MSLEPYPAATVSSAVARTARWHPDSPAFIDADTGTVHTFASVWGAISHLAGKLQAEGLRRGDRVALFAPNSSEWAVAYHAILLAGGVVTTLNPLYREREVAHQLEDAAPVACFTARSTRELVADVRQSTDRLYLVEDVWRDADLSPGTHAPAGLDPAADLAVLPYSSGTTGAPKGVMLTHANLTANVRQFLATGMTDAFSVSIDFLPFFHIYGMTVLLNAGLAAGATQVVMPTFDPERFLDLIERYQATTLFVVPPALAALAGDDATADRDLSSVRTIVSGAAPLPLELARQVRERHGLDVLQGYGMTEASPVTHVSLPGRDKEGTIGPPISDTLQRVVGPDATDCGTGEMGELLVSGPQVMAGYWNNDQATRETLIVDAEPDDPDTVERTWLRTGDIVTVDDDGYVTIQDRAKEMIKYRGYQVAPAELEAVLIEHPDVVDAAVVGRRAPDTSDEIPVAFVVLDNASGPSPDRLIQHVTERVAPYKKVRHVEIVESIPRTASGKILRRQLADGMAPQGSGQVGR